MWDSAWYGQWQQKDVNWFYVEMIRKIGYKEFHMSPQMVLVSIQVI